MSAKFRNFKDFFLDNTLSNVPEALSAFGISESYETFYEGVTSLQVISWEWQHCVQLPKDLKNFYKTTNGYLYTWTGKTDLPKYPMLSGKIEINDLGNLIEIKGFVRRAQTQYKMTGLVVKQIEISEDWKIFALCSIKGGMVVLAYMKGILEPIILVCTQFLELFYLAKDFTTYMELATYYMGISEWELMYTSQGAPDHTILLFSTLKPQILAYTNKSNIYQEIIKNSLKNIVNIVYKFICIDYNGPVSRRPISSRGGFFQDNQKDNPANRIGMIILFPIEYKLRDLPVFNGSIGCPNSDCFGYKKATYSTTLKLEKRLTLQITCTKKENQEWLPFTWNT